MFKADWTSLNFNQRRRELNQENVINSWLKETPLDFMLELQRSYNIVYKDKPTSVVRRTQLHLNLYCYLFPSFIKFCTHLSEQLKRKKEGKILSVGYTSRSRVKKETLICISHMSLGSTLYNLSSLSTSKGNLWNPKGLD